MTAFYVTAAALVVLAMALLLRPVWARRPQGAESRVQALSSQLAQLGALHRAGALTDEQFADSREAIERRLLACIGDAEGGVASPARPSRRVIAGLVGLLCAVVVFGYAWLGSPLSLGFGPGSGGTPMASVGDPGGSDGAPAAPHALQPEQVAAMVAQLEKRLKSEPDDGEGWLMMARSLVVLGKHAQAVDAFKQALRLRPDDSNLLADYADALAIASDRRLDGEPTRLVERALEVDGSNPKALALAGTAAFDRHDYAGAVRHWEKLVEVAPGDNALVQQIKGGIAEARELGGLPAAVAAPPAEDGAATTARVSGTVVLAPSLRNRVSPDDTVFVFARAVEGGRMPLAILRKKVGDLPLQFTLDDAMAMSESARLSTAQRVIVGARISKSGNATPQEGDLQGATGVVAVGSTGLRVEIDRKVTR